MLSSKSMTNIVVNVYTGVMTAAVNFDLCYLLKMKLTRSSVFLTFLMNAISISVMCCLCSNSNIIKSKHAVSRKSMHNLHISI